MKDRSDDPSTMSGRPTTEVHLAPFIIRMLDYFCSYIKYQTVKHEVNVSQVTPPRFVMGSGKMIICNYLYQFTPLSTPQNEWRDEFLLYYKTNKLYSC